MLLKTLVDPDFFSVDAPPALFRDFSLPTVDLVVPSSGPAFGGTLVAVFLKEMNLEMFLSCAFVTSEGSRSCDIVYKLVKLSSTSDTMIITNFEVDSCRSLRTQNQSRFRF